MPLNHTFSLTMCNTKLIIKLALLIIVLALIALAVLSSVIMPIISDIADIINSIDVTPDDLINHPIITVRTEFLDRIMDYLKASDWREVIGIIVAVYFCIRFFITVPQLPLAKVIYNKMSTGYDIGLFNAFVSTGFQNLLLSLILAIVTSAINIGLIIGFFSLMKLCFQGGAAFIAVPFIIIAFIAAYSAKSAILSQWMPEICASQTKNIFIGLKVAVKTSNGVKWIRYKGGRIYGNYRFKDNDEEGPNGIASKENLSVRNDWFATKRSSNHYQRNRDRASEEERRKYLPSELSKRRKRRQKLKRKCFR